MFDPSKLSTWEQRSDDLWTTWSGWAAGLFLLLGIHRWVAAGFDWWARAGVMLGVGLTIIWVGGLSPRILERLRYLARTGGLNNTAVALGLIVALILVNTLVRRRAFLKLDLTQNQRFTLSQRSREILKALPEPIHATAFIPAGRSTAKARDLFKQYSDASDKFAWTHIDPLVDRKATMEKKPKLSEFDLTGAVLEYRGKSENVSEFSEKEVTSAILKLTRDNKRQILFLKGHGEPDVTATGGGDPQRSLRDLVEDLKSLQWQVDSLDLYPKETKAPEVAKVAVVVIAGPRRELTEDEQKKLDEYLGAGGRVLVLMDARGPSLSKWLAKWGIQTANDLVLGAGNGGLVMAEPDRNHQAVKAFGRVIFPPMRSVRAASPAPTGITVTELVKSGPNADWIENFDEKTTNLREALQTAKPGPVSVAALAEKTSGSGDSAKTARLVVIGDLDFTTDNLARQLSMVAFNLALTKGLVNYLGEEQALVAIPPKDENTEQAFLTPEQGRLLSLIHFWDFPLLALMLAIMVYLKRR
jgi:ABC-type uncharacterized transport system involved in gliding motility auxiliary subunit